MNDKIRFINELLSELEDTIKGSQGDDITIARRYLKDITIHISEPEFDNRTCSMCKWHNPPYDYTGKCVKCENNSNWMPIKQI